MSVRPKAHLIANTKSGKGEGEKLPEIGKKIAGELGIDLVYYDTSDPTQFDNQIAKAVAAAKKDGGTVIAAGGDGTIRSVAQRAVESDVTFGVVACGTFNFFARNHRIPEQVEEAFRLALTGEVRPVRLGRVNGQYFLINASLGTYAKAMRVREKDAKRFGRDRLVAVLSTIRTFFSRSRDLDVELVTADSRVSLKTMTIFIGNNALQLRDLAMNVAKCMQHELLAAVVLKRVTRWQLVRILLRGIAKTLENEERLEMFCVESLTIKLRRSAILVALDGEMFMMTPPLQVDARPRALNMRLPPKLPA